MSIATLEVNSPPATPALPGQRLPMLDVMRLVAAYAIVWLHSPSSPELARWTAIGRFAVPLFTAAAVFLTWEGVARSPRRGLAEYARSRFLRIYVPFLAWSLLYLAFKGAKAVMLPGQANDFPGLEVFWLGSFFHLWFMPFILAVTLAVFGAARLTVGHLWRENLVCAGCLILGWWTCWLPVDRESATVSFWQLAADALPAAVWGAALAIAWQRGAARWLRRPKVGAVALAAGLLFIAAVCILLRNRPAENLAGVALLVFALADWRAAWLQRIARFGSLAYGIYLSHLLFIKTVQAVEAKLHFEETPAVVLGTWALAVLGSTLLAWLLCRSRATRWLAG